MCPQTPKRSRDMLTLAEHVLKQDRKNCISEKQMESRQQTNEWKYKYLPHTKLKIKQNTKQQCRSTASYASCTANQRWASSSNLFTCEVMGKIRRGSNLGRWTWWLLTDLSTATAWNSGFKDDKLRNRIWNDTNVFQNIEQQVFHWNFPSGSTWDSSARSCLGLRLVCWAVGLGVRNCN